MIYRKTDSQTDIYNVHRVLGIKYQDLKWFSGLEKSW